MNKPLQTTEGFSAQTTELARTETASNAVAAQAKAAVESRYIMAMNRPRNWDDVRTKLLNDCKRPGFAVSALYNKPIGKGIEGFSIRFVEAALRAMTNVLPEVSTVYDDSEKKIVRATVTDLEANLTYSKDITITKTVERSKPQSDGTYISVRKNSYNKIVYTIPGTDDDILNKENALVSKAIRTLGLRLVPGDILDECDEMIRGVMKNKNAEDPDAARKKMIDAFTSIGVSAAMLEEYIGHPLPSVSPAQLIDLRSLYSTINDGESTWKEVMDNKQRNTPPTTKEKKTNGKGNGKSNLKENLKEKLKEKLKAEDPPPIGYAELLDQVKNATTTDDIDVAIDLANSLPEDRRDEIHKYAESRMEELF